MHRIISIPGIILSLILFIVSNSSASASNIEGIIKDILTNEPLIGANVILTGTSLGAATDGAGKYVIRNIPAGSYNMKVTYIGYETREEPVQISANEILEKNFSLKPVGIEGETVVITAQASGQMEAINKQLSSNNILNAVSSARIQELPDANAAESIGRLPGISVLRNGGEGNEVVIRGLAPKYNLISVNGVQLSSSNSENRSIDLSMITSNMLEGIEVSKTVTADMDANVIGGSVNFELREAKSSGSTFPTVGLLLQGSYNGLSNAYNKYNNYKFGGSAENRFLNDKLGILALVDIERKNLTSNEFGADYDHKGESNTEYITTALNLYTIPRDRQRYNGTVIMDYKMPEGVLKLSNFLSSGTTDIQERSEAFVINTNLHNYGFSYSRDKLSIITNSISLNYNFPFFTITSDFSHTYSETKSPNDWTFGFQQGSAGLNSFVNVSNLNPRNIPLRANNDTSQTYLSTLTTNNSFSRERALTASINFESNLNISSLISSTIKFGGKYRHQTRSYDLEQTTGQGLGLPSASSVDSLLTSHFPSTRRYMNTTQIPILPFVDPNFDYGKFLDGDYKMILPLNYSMLGEAAEYIKSKTDYLAKLHSIAFFRDPFNSTTLDYSGYEDQSAAYAMATINIGPDITMIPGIRYQNLKTVYTAPRGTQNTGSATGGGPYRHYDTTVTVNHGYWLPNINIKYKPLSWFDIRLSYTNTLSYPDYNAIVPRIDVAVSSSPIYYNNFQLSPTRSRNYDAYLSFYENTLGLFTVGGYIKQIDDLIYQWSFFVTGANSLKYYPPSYPATSIPTINPNIITYVNNPNRVNVRGLEFDWQTHFWYLPHPFDGLILNVNYTRVFSETKYPYTFRRPGRIIVYVDTVFTDRLLYQPDNIINLSIGYDYKDFSIRVSMLYQDDIFAGPNFWEQLRTTTASYTRWDLAVKQDLPWFGIQLFGALNNLNSAKDINIIQKAGIPQSQQHYGMTADVGLRLKL